MYRAPIAGIVTRTGEPGKSARELLRGMLLPELLALEQPSDNGQHLAWRRRLYEVFVHTAPDRLDHRAILLGLRDHYHTSVRRFALQISENIEPTLAGHLLIEQQEVISLVTRHRKRVVAIRCRIDFVTALTQEHEMGLEELHFVINPKNPFRNRHGYFYPAGSGSGRLARGTYWSSTNFTFSSTAPTVTRCMPSVRYSAFNG